MSNNETEKDVENSEEADEKVIKVTNEPDLQEYELPFNWKKQCRRRKSGNTWDVYITHGSSGKKFRSNVAINDYLTNNPDIKCNRQLTNCKRPREMSPGKSEGKETKKIKLDKKDVPNSYLIQPVIPNIIKRGRPTKSQSGLESEVTSPQVVKKPLPTKNEKEVKIDEKSQNGDGFTCVKCDKWSRSERHHSKHVQTCSVSKNIGQKECLPIETKKDWGILTPQKDEKSSINPVLYEDIESKSDELPSKNRISVIAFRKQPNKKNSVKSQPDIEKVLKTNSEAEVEIQTENPNENLVKMATETEVEDEIEKVVEPKIEMRLESEDESMTKNFNNNEITKNDGNEITKNDGNEIKKNVDHEITKNDGNEITKNDGNEITKNVNHEITKNSFDNSSSDDCCKKCGNSEKQELLLLCDKCDNGWHTFCLTPALSKVPEGDWFCPDCQTPPAEVYDCTYTLPDGTRCPKNYTFYPFLMKHQTQHQNDLPCGCYICQDTDEKNPEMVCDYVCPDTKIACGHQDLNISFLNVHKAKYGHTVFGKGRKQYQCDGCWLIFEYWQHWNAHECTNESKRNLDKYSPPEFKIPEGYHQILLQSKPKKTKGE